MQFLPGERYKFETTAQPEDGITDTFRFFPAGDPSHLASTSHDQFDVSTIFSVVPSLPSLPFNADSMEMALSSFEYLNATY